MLANLIFLPNYGDRIYFPARLWRPLKRANLVWTLPKVLSTPATLGLFQYSGWIYNDLKHVIMGSNMYAKKNSPTALPLLPHPAFASSIATVADSASTPRGRRPRLRKNNNRRQVNYKVRRR